MHFRMMINLFSPLFMNHLLCRDVFAILSHVCNGLPLRSGNSRFGAPERTGFLAQSVLWDTPRPTHRGIELPCLNVRDVVARPARLPPPGQPDPVDSGFPDRQLLPLQRRGELEGGRRVHQQLQGPALLLHRSWCLSGCGEVHNLWTMVVVSSLRRQSSDQVWMQRGCELRGRRWVLKHLQGSAFLLHPSWGLQGRCEVHLLRTMVVLPGLWEQGGREVQLQRASQLEKGRRVPNHVQRSSILLRWSGGL